MSVPSRLSKYFYEPPEDRANRIGPPLRGAFDSDDIDDTGRDTFPFQNHRTLAEAWRSQFYRLRWKRGV